MAKTYTYTEAQINLISEALNDADSFYDCFDDDNDGRGEIIRRGLEALSQSDSPCSHDGEHQESPRPTVNYYGQEIESDYVPHMKEIADVLRQAAPTSRHQPGCDGSGSHRRGCTYGFNGPHDPIKWCADNCPRCEDLWTSKMERDQDI